MSGVCGFGQIPDLIGKSLRCHGRVVLGRNCNLSVPNANIDSKLTVDIGGNVNMRATTIDFRNSTINFTGASITGLDLEATTFEDLSVTGNITVGQSITAATVTGNSLTATTLRSDFMYPRSGDTIYYYGKQRTFFPIETSSEITQTSTGINIFQDFNAHQTDLSIHFTEASVDHLNILNVGTNTHAQIDSHITGTGDEHTYLDQSVTSNASPSFSGITVGQLLPTTETITAGANIITQSVTTSFLDTSGGASQLNILPGITGQIKTLTMTNYGAGNAAVLNGNLVSNVTITFAGNGESAILVFNGATWSILGNYGASVV